MAWRFLIPSMPPLPSSSDTSPFLAPLPVPFSLDGWTSSVVEPSQYRLSIPLSYHSIPHPHLPSPMIKPHLSRIVALTAFAVGSIASGQESITEKLTLKEVIARALGNNQDIEVRNLDKVVEQERIKIG